MHLQKTGIISKIVNAGYYSPFNMAVSDDGRHLYIIAEEADKLLVADTEKQKVISEIEVGSVPIVSL